MRVKKLSAAGLQSAGSAMAEALQDAVANSCNQFEHAPGCEHSDSSSAADAPDMEPREKRQEEREHLEELLAEIDRQEEAARDADAMLESGYTEDEARRQYNEEAARDRWNAISREGDPQTREDIEERLGELEREDVIEETRASEAGKAIQSVIDSLKSKEEGDEPSQNPVRVSPVDEELAKKVKALNPKTDIREYHHTLTADRVHHTQQKHGYISDDDFMLLPDIIRTGSVEFRKKKGGDRLIYTKSYGSRVYEVAERIGNPESNPNLMFSTEYIKFHPKDAANNRKRKKRG